MSIVFASLATWFAFWMTLCILSFIFEWNRLGDAMMKILAISAVITLIAFIIFIFTGMWMQALGYEI